MAHLVVVLGNYLVPCNLLMTLIINGDGYIARLNRFCLKSLKFNKFEQGNCLKMSLHID